MRPSRLLSLALLAAASTPAIAQVQDGDLIFVHSELSNSHLTAVGSDGTTHVQAVSQFGTQSWISGARLSDGRFVMHENGLQGGFWIYSEAGLYQFNFFQGPTPSYSSDMGAFSDDVLVVSVRDEGLRMYDLTSTFLGTLTAPGMLKPFGLQVQSDDTVWVVDQQNWPVTNGGRVFHLDRNGAVLHEFDVPFDPSDIAAAPDGSLWISAYSLGEVHRYQPDGTFVSSFSAQIAHNIKSLWSLVVTGDGTIWTSGHYEDRVNAFDSQGNVLTQFDLQVAGNSVFTFGAGGLDWATPGCFGDGSSGVCLCGNNGLEEEGCMNSTGRGGRLDVLGTNRVSLDDFGLLATHLPANKPALAVVGTQSLVGGGFIGEGFRCVGGPTTHLGVQFTDAAGTAQFGPNLASVGGWTPGSTRTFQVWFRDPQGGPCGQGANTTNTQETVFQP